MLDTDSEYSSDGSTSESDCESACSVNKPLRIAIKTALNMEANKPNSDSIRDVISELLHAPPSSATRKKTKVQTTNKTSIDSIMGCVTEIKSDLSKHHDKMDKLLQILLVFLDKVGDLEQRIISLENHQSSTSKSYSTAVTSHNDSPNNDRIERLEYLSSEEERKKRLLQVSLKHPLIDLNSPDLCKHVKDFMCQTLRMDSREIDSNLTATKAPKNSSVIITLTHRRFKLFLYRARKTLRENNVNDSNTGL